MIEYSQNFDKVNGDLYYNIVKLDDNGGRPLYIRKKTFFDETVAQNFVTVGFYWLSSKLSVQLLLESFINKFVEGCKYTRK